MNTNKKYFVCFLVISLLILSMQVSVYADNAYDATTKDLAEFFAMAQDPQNNTTAHKSGLKNSSSQQQQQCPANLITIQRMLCELNCKLCRVLNILGEPHNGTSISECLEILKCSSGSSQNCCTTGMGANCCNPNTMMMLCQQALGFFSNCCGTMNFDTICSMLSGSCSNTSYNSCCNDPCAANSCCSDPCAIKRSPSNPATTIDTRELFKDLWCACLEVFEKYQQEKLHIDHETHEQLIMHEQPYTTPTEL